MHVLSQEAGKNKEEGLLRIQSVSCLWLVAGVRPPDLNYQRGDRRVELSHAVLQDDLQFTRANSTSKSSLFGLLHSSVLRSIAEQAIITLHPYSWRSLLIPSSAGSFVAQRESLLFGIREGGKGAPSHSHQSGVYSPVEPAGSWKKLLLTPKGKILPGAPRLYW